ncbi:MAG: YdcF family protein [Flavobacteriaceae bacterium]|nr:YdcF family protein [Flavobacteriaceae bacterium]
MRKIIKVVSFFIVIGLLSIPLANYCVDKKTEGKLYNNVRDIPYNKVGLVLGTAKYLQNGSVNLYYTYRINATLQLYKAGKISFVLVSGDNGSTVYDEPTTFKEDLIKGGIPSELIYLDYAGFRTLDSMIRAKAVFGQSNITVISQEFHNQRAVFIADYIGVSAVGFNAKNVSSRYGFKTNIREKLARVKVFIDLVIGVEPRFLGPLIEIK